MNSIPLPSRVHFGLLLAGLLPLACAPSGTGEAPAESREDPSATAPGGLTGSDMLSYLEAKVDIADEKFVSMAEAIPEDSWDWRPMEGVRSFAEVFQHVAADNWYGGALLGLSTPGDVIVGPTQESVDAYQDLEMSRAEVIAELRRSFDFLDTALDGSRDRLHETAMLRELELTYGDLWVRLITHMHEHLGQTIAYARANEIVPPWSR